MVVLVLDAPVADVRPEEAEIRPLRECGVERVPDRNRPVLVVAVDEHGSVGQQARRVAIRVEVGLVGDVVAFTLQEADELDLPLPGRLVAARQRPLEGDARRTTARRVGVVKALPAPRVVRLPRVHRDLHEDRGSALGVRADDERLEGRFPLLNPGSELELCDVEAARPAGRDRQFVRHRPSGTGPAALRCRILRAVGVLPAVLRNAGEPAPAEPVVPAQPEDVDVVGLGRLRRDVEVDRPAGGDGDFRAVALDRRSANVGPRPFGGSLLRVLCRDGVPGRECCEKNGEEAQSVIGSTSCAQAPETRYSTARRRSKRSASSNGPMTARRSASSSIRSAATRCTSSAVTASIPARTSCGSGVFPSSTSRRRPNEINPCGLSVWSANRPLAKLFALWSSSSGTASAAIFRSSVATVSTASSIRSMSTPACAYNEPASV